MTGRLGVPYRRRCAGEKSRNLALCCCPSCPPCCGCGGCGAVCPACESANSATGITTFLGCPAEFMTRCTTTDPPRDCGSDGCPVAFRSMPAHVHPHTSLQSPCTPSWPTSHHDSYGLVPCATCNASYQPSGLDGLLPRSHSCRHNADDLPAQILASLTLHQLCTPCHHEHTPVPSLRP